MVALVHGQGTPYDSPVQYHIQTDEGPERFFRFQTETGQYREEQRHLDGSVTGTYGWVDPNGILRLFDYISDKDGYRIDQQREFKVGKPINNVVRIPTLGGKDIELGFEVLPLDGANSNVVEPINNHITNQIRKPRAPEPEADPQFPASTIPLGSANNVCTNEGGAAVPCAGVSFGNPIFGQGQAPYYHGGAPFYNRQGQAPFYHGGAPFLHHPVVPYFPPPPPRIVIVEEQAPPEPEPFVIGSAGTSLPDVPKPTRKFVIGAAANGDEVRRPLPSRKSTVGAAAVERQQVVSSRQTTVIGAAANSGSGRNLSPSRPAPKAAPKREFSGIVIGLRHDRRKRLIMPFDDFMY